MDAPLTWTRKNWTMRELNNGHFDKDDPRGDEFHFYDFIAWSGKLKVATVAVTQPLYANQYHPANAITCVEVKSILIGNKFYSYDGRNDEGDFKPAIDDIETIKTNVQVKWAKWLEKAELVAK